jgi:hypothetical protein
LIPFNENGNDDCMVGYEFSETCVCYVEDMVNIMFSKESHSERIKQGKENGVRIC